MRMLPLAALTVPLPMFIEPFVAPPAINVMVPVPVVVRSRSLPPPELIEPPPPERPLTAKVCVVSPLLPLGALVILLGGAAGAMVKLIPEPMTMEEFVPPGAMVVVPLSSVMLPEAKIVIFPFAFRFPTEMFPALS